MTEDRMTCDEIRWRSSKGVATYVLAELNDCSRLTIEYIIKHDGCTWADALKSNRLKYIIVNSTDGRFYPSIRAAEKGEHISHPLLQKRFQGGVTRTIVHGKEFHLYNREA